MLDALRRHWLEYLLEAAGLAAFVTFAGGLTILTKNPESPLISAIGSPFARRALLALVMTGVVAAIVYSPAGTRSGAHINPAVTWAFFRLKKIKPVDAVWYTVAQFAGAIAAAFALSLVFGPLFSNPSVMFGASVPGPLGDGVAFLAEFVITYLLMLMLLVFVNSKRLKPYLGAAIAVLIGVYLVFETPLSGMSLNPARSLASALAGGPWKGIWLYFIAPPLAALLAAETFVQLRRHQFIVASGQGAPGRWALVRDFEDGPDYPTPQPEPSKAAPL